MTFQEIKQADIRRKILSQCLCQQTDYKENEHIIKAILNEYGHAVSTDQVRTHLEYLREQTLIEITEISQNLWVAKLTQRGLDAAEGRINIHGIARKEL